jgi:hypothetical protein
MMKFPVMGERVGMLGPLIWNVTGTSDPTALLDRSTPVIFTANQTVVKSAVDAAMVALAIALPQLHLKLL